MLNRVEDQIKKLATLTSAMLFAAAEAYAQDPNKTEAPHAPPHRCEHPGPQVGGH